MDALQCDVHRGQIKAFRVERPTDPFLIMLIFFVGRVGEHFPEPFVTSDATAVFGAAACPARWVLSQRVDAYVVGGCVRAVASLRWPHSTAPVSNTAPTAAVPVTVKAA